MVVVESEEGPPPHPEGKSPHPLPQAIEGGQGGGPAPLPKPLMWGLGRHLGHPHDGHLPAFGGAEVGLVEGKEGLGQHLACPGRYPRNGQQEGGGAGDGEGGPGEAQEGRQKAEVEAAQLRVPVEGLWRTRDDL